MDVFTAGADTSTYEQVPATCGGGVGVYREKVQEACQKTKIKLPIDSFILV